jgi:hypothetical protein
MRLPSVSNVFRSQALLTQTDNTVRALSIVYDRECDAHDYFDELCWWMSK